MSRPRATVRTASASVTLGLTASTAIDHSRARPASVSEKLDEAPRIDVATAGDDNNRSRQVRGRQAVECRQRDRAGRLEHELELGRRAPDGGGDLVLPRPSPRRRACAARWANGIGAGASPRRPSAIVRPTDLARPGDPTATGQRLLGVGGQRRLNAEHARPGRHRLHGRRDAGRQPTQPDRRQDSGGAGRRPARPTAQRFRDRLCPGRQ